MCQYHDKRLAAGGKRRHEGSREQRPTPVDHLYGKVLEDSFIVDSVLQTKLHSQANWSASFSAHVMSVIVGR
jgi:hypothetical protein